jgi:Na+/melibiose symporter-like transporter
MGWVGLCYAVSQGFAAKFFMRYTGEDPTQLILICLAVLSAGRVVAMLTSSLVVVYLIMAMVIMALGIVNTAMASACARLADADEVIMIQQSVASPLDT